MEDYKELEQIGLSVNEAKVYLALLKNGVMNGYSVAKISGVSRTMVYDVLNRLNAKGFVNVAESELRLYCAVDYHQLIGNLKKDYEKKLSNAEELLAKASVEEQSERYIINVNGFDEMLIQAKRIIDAATTDLYLSIWIDEYRMLEKHIAAAAKRGVNVYIFSFCCISTNSSVCFSYNIADAEDLFPVRRMLIISDHREMLVCENGDGAEKIGLTTKNKMLIKLSVDELVMDIIHYHCMKKAGVLKDTMTALEYIAASDKFTSSVSLPEKIPFNTDVDNFLKEARK